MADVSMLAKKGTQYVAVPLSNTVAIAVYYSHKKDNAKRRVKVFQKGPSYTKTDLEILKKRLPKTLCLVNGIVEAMFLCVKPGRWVLVACRSTAKNIPTQNVGGVLVPFSSKLRRVEEAGNGRFNTSLQGDELSELNLGIVNQSWNFAWDVKAASYMLLNVNGMSSHYLFTRRTFVEVGKKSFSSVVTELTDRG